MNECWNCGMACCCDWEDLWREQPDDCTCECCFEPFDLDEEEHCHDPGPAAG